MTESKSTKEEKKVSKATTPSSKKTDKVERPKATKPKEYKQPVVTPPAKLAEHGDKIIITLNSSGNVADVEFTGNSWMIAQGKRPDQWATQIRFKARLASRGHAVAKSKEPEKKDDK